MTALTLLREFLTGPRDRTPDSDVPPDDFRNHPEGFEDGYDEEWEGEPDAGGYPEDEAWFASLPMTFVLGVSSMFGLALWEGFALAVGL